MRQKIKSRTSEAVPKLISFWEGSSHDDSLASDNHGDLSKVPRLISFWEGGTMKKKSEEKNTLDLVKHQQQAYWQDMAQQGVQASKYDTQCSLKALEK